MRGDFGADRFYDPQALSRWARAREAVQDPVRPTLPQRIKMMQKGNL